MACSGCNSTNCRGCKDIKINLPAANGIDSVTDNGDGTFTITTTDGTATVITMTVPNDNWVELEIGDLPSAPLWNSSKSTLNDFTSLDVKYKIINVDTVVISVKARVDITTNVIDAEVNFNFRLDPFTSNWFTGTKLGNMATATSQLYAPVSVVIITAVAAPRYTVGRAYCTPFGGQTLVSVGNTDLQLPNGNYIAEVNFQLTAKLDV